MVVSASASRSIVFATRERRLRDQSDHAIRRAAHLVDEARAILQMITQARRASPERRAMPLRGRSDAGVCVLQIREKLVDGRLPATPGKAAHGHASGTACDACNDRVNPPDIEVVVTIDGGGLLHLHNVCFALWTFEVRRMLDRARPRSTRN